MTKITIEKINGVEHTVIWFKPYNKKTLEQTASDGLTYLHDKGWVEQYYDYITIFPTNQILITKKDANHHVNAIALPPLPHKPTADDTKLLHLYAAHGLYAYGESFIENWNTKRCAVWEFIEAGCYYENIICAIDEQGNRIEIVICD
jgi:hypothetical protein